MQKTLLALTTAMAIISDTVPAALPDRAGTDIGFYGLVIGIDNYQAPIPALDGAVNDAKAVADALRGVGAEVTELMDEAATRDNIKRAWDAIVGKAKDGDIVVFSYAGHGAQSPERVPGSEDDGQDEYFVLRDFQPDGPKTYERIVDDDLSAWFGQAPRLKILLLADSCHSGTMTRGYQEAKQKYRYVKMPPITRDALPPPNPAEVDQSGPARPPAPGSAVPSAVFKPAMSIPHVVSMSAVADHELDPEIYIDGNAHGALSWYFAQGLLGEADGDSDGQITAVEMKDYLYESVKNKTEGQQHPQFGNADARPVAKPKNAKVHPVFAEPQAIDFALAGEAGDLALADYAKAQLKHVNWTGAMTARLEWNLRGNVINNRFGDLVYRLVEPPPAAPGKTKAFVRVEVQADARTKDMVDQIQAVVDKFAVVDTLGSLANGGLAVSLHPNDKLHKNGERVTLRVEGMKYPFFTLFNLASDGSVNLLYPILASDSPSLPRGQPYDLQIDVSPPFGADHFIAISSAAQLSDLHQALKDTNGKRPDWPRLLERIRADLKDADHQVGLHPTFTVE